MAIYSLTGNDTLIINKRVFSELADNSTIELTFNNDRIGTSTGKNDNTIISDNRQGGNATLTLRVIRGSYEDTVLNGWSVLQDRDLPSFTLMSGTFTKRIGNGFGFVHFDNYVLQGGAFQRSVEVQENLNGETEQAVAIYTIFFSKVTRAIA